MFGKNGQLATGLQQQAWPAGWQMQFLGRGDSDLERLDDIAAVINRIRPELVINAAAYTAVDKAESDLDAAHRINALAPAAMAAATAALDIPLITISTDYVFDGSKTQAYRETDPVAPLGVYGTTKEEGERLVRAANHRHLILRTSWVYSAWGNNFVRTMLRLGAQKPVLRVVADQQGRPTAAADLAKIVALLSASLLAGKDDFGTFHVANEGATNWHSFAEAVFAGAKARGASVPERVEPIATSDYPTAARRPANSVLATQKLEDVFGIRSRPWPDALNEVLDALLPARMET